jgi:hypothetical protein
LENQNPSKTEPAAEKTTRPKPTITSTWSQHGKSQPAQEKVATRNRVQALNQKSNPKHKKPQLKVATFTKPKVAT